MSPQQAAAGRLCGPVEPDRRPILEMLIASIDLSEVTFNQ